MKDEVQDDTQKLAHCAAAVFSYGGLVSNGNGLVLTRKSKRADRNHAIYGKEYHRRSLRAYGRVSVGNTGGSRNAPFYVSYQASLANSEILYKSERFEVPFGTWLYSDVVLERAGGTLQQVMLQVDADVAGASEPFGSLVIYNTANSVPTEQLSLNFDKITWKY